MNIVLIGKPGCGKGSLCEKLVADGWYQLSPGELMRAKMQDNDETAQLLRDLLNRGNFAPDEITIKIVQDAVSGIKEKNPDANIIFDGFPRTTEQAKMLVKSFDIDMIVYFEIEDKLILDRITNRLVHKPSGRVYNKISKPPLKEGLDDETGEALTVRNDDRAELVEQRIANFMNLTFPAYQFLISPEVNINHVVVDGALGPVAIKSQLDNVLGKTVSSKPRRN